MNLPKMIDTKENNDLLTERRGEGEFGE